MPRRVREVEFVIIYGRGISREGEILDLAEVHQVLERTGTWYAYKGERIGQGRDNARVFLKENKDISLKMEKDIFEKSGIAKPASKESSKEAAKESKPEKIEVKKKAAG